MPHMALSRHPPWLTHQERSSLIQLVHVPSGTIISPTPDSTFPVIRTDLELTANLCLDPSDPSLVLLSAFNITVLMSCDLTQIPVL